jgi:hypothetical protein
MSTITTGSGFRPNIDHETAFKKVMTFDLYLKLARNARLDDCIMNDMPSEYGYFRLGSKPGTIVFVAGIIPYGEERGRARVCKEQLTWSPGGWIRSTGESFNTIKEFLSGINQSVHNGYPDKSLADITIWMMPYAEDFDLSDAMKRKGLV